jgi:hypothetical protein
MWFAVHRGTMIDLSPSPDLEFWMFPMSVIRLFCSLTAGVWVPAGVRDFYLLHSVQTVSGAHLASCLMGIGGSFLGDKAVGTSS